MGLHSRTLGVARVYMAVVHSAIMSSIQSGFKRYNRGDTKNEPGRAMDGTSTTGYFGVTCHVVSDIHLRKFKQVRQRGQEKRVDCPGNGGNLSCVFDAQVLTHGRQQAGLRQWVNRLRAQWVRKRGGGGATGEATGSSRVDMINSHNWIRGCIATAIAMGYNNEVELVVFVFASTFSLVPFNMSSFRRRRFRGPAKLNLVPKALRHATTLYYYQKAIRKSK